MCAGLCVGGACVQVQAWEVYIRSMYICRLTHKQVYANTRSVAHVGHPSTPCVPSPTLAFFLHRVPLLPGERASLLSFI